MSKHIHVHVHDSAFAYNGTLNVRGMAQEWVRRIRKAQWKHKLPGIQDSACGCDKTNDGLDPFLDPDLAKIAEGKPPNIIQEIYELQLQRIQSRQFTEFP
jgi:hypothetical protein